MYYIIGGDGKQYGPITEADIRKWIAEGRLNHQTQAKAEGDTAFRQLFEFPEFADLFGAAVPEVPAGPVDWSTRDYELDIMGCAKQAWNMTINHFGQLFLPVFILLCIGFIIGMLSKIPYVGPLLSLSRLFFTGQLMAGIYYVYILTIRGEATETGMVFEGFRRDYWQLFLGYIVPALAVVVCLIPFFIVFVIKGMPVFQQFNNMNAENPDSVREIMGQLGPVFMVSLPVLAICMIPIMYLTTAWRFTLALIIDKQMNFWTAMMTSMKMVNKHWLTVFGLLIVMGLINMAGMLVCCVGLIFTIPMSYMMLMLAYETIFGEQGTS
jgi:hypothetical protein